jgi:hypothetical protein
MLNYLCYSEDGTRAPDVDFETTEVLVQCEEGEEVEDEDLDDQEQEDLDGLAVLCPVCRHKHHANKNEREQQF